MKLLPEPIPRTEPYSAFYRTWSCAAPRMATGSHFNWRTEYRFSSMGMRACLLPMTHRLDARSTVGSSRYILNVKPLVRGLSPNTRIAHSGVWYVVLHIINALSLCLVSKSVQLRLVCRDTYVICHPFTRGMMCSPEICTNFSRMGKMWRLKF